MLDAQQRNAELRDVVARMLGQERLSRKKAEWGRRCYADVLALYAHKLAIAQNRSPEKVLNEARQEVRTRLKEKEWLD